MLPKRVPPPEARVAALVADIVHSSTRSFRGKEGLIPYWNPRFGGQECTSKSHNWLLAVKLCDRVKSSFNIKDSVLKPLPIMGLGYRWSCDLAGPLPPSATRLSLYHGHDRALLKVARISSTN